MADGAMPKPLQDLAGLFLVVMVGGAMVLGWLNNRGRSDKAISSGDGSSADDDPHHHGWWSGGADDGGHHGGDDGGH